MPLWQLPFTPEHMFLYYSMLTYYCVLQASINGKQDLLLHHNTDPNCPVLSAFMDFLQRGAGLYILHYVFKDLL